MTRCLVFYKSAREGYSHKDYCYVRTMESVLEHESALPVIISSKAIIVIVVEVVKIYRGEVEEETIWIKPIWIMAAVYHII
jgi:hypothetical protein